MEGADEYARCCFSQQGFGPFLHLPGRAVGERYGQNALRLDALMYEISDPAYEGHGLACARAGHNKERTVNRRSGLPLRKVQAVN